MRRGTLEAYKQTFLVPAKLIELRAVYLCRATQERADFVVRRLGDRGANLSSFVERIVRAQRNGESCNPSTQIHQRVHERYAYLTSSNRLNAWYAVIVRNTAGT